MNPWNDSDAYAREASKVESAGEAVLLSLLWWRRAGWTVRAQEPLEQYRIDLFVPEAGVAIEVDSFGGHGSNDAMERDARKRNLVVARGWAPLSFSARETIFKPHDTLAHAMAVIGSRLVTPRAASVGAVSHAVPSLAIAAAGGRALLDALNGREDGTLRLSATLREMANRPAGELVAVQAFAIVLEQPALVRDDDVRGPLLAAGGPVALAAVELAARLRPDGTVDVPAFLGRCPAMLQPLAAEVLAAPWPDPATAKLRAMALLCPRRAA